MFKKAFILFTLTLLTFGLSISVEAGFFKKFRSSKKETKQEAITASKPVTLALIFASWCPGCKNIQPTIDQVEKEFANQVVIIYFDVSTPKNAIESLKKAKELNLVDFYSSNKSKTSTVGIIVQKTSEIVTVFQNNNKIDDYKSAIQEALTKAQALENPPT